MQTVIKYQDTALPTAAVDVTLFNSVTAFPPGGWFHLLNQQWYQWAIFMNSAGGGASAVLTGEYSDDRGANWFVFYTSGTVAEDLEESDEIYVGMFKDVRFVLNVGGENLTVFRCNQALNDCKPTSKVNLSQNLHNDTAAIAAIQTTA